jgi:hypothetical protein
MLKRFGSHFRHDVVAYRALFVALAATAAPVRRRATAARYEW